MQHIENDHRRGGIDAILIEDDPFVRDAWRADASAQGFRLLALGNPEDLQDYDLDLETPIFVDIKLANEISGIDVARRLHGEGFRCIWFATGYEADDLDCPKFIAGVVGKEFPIDLFLKR